MPDCLLKPYRTKASWLNMFVHALYGVYKVSAGGAVHSHLRIELNGGKINTLLSDDIFISQRVRLYEHKDGKATVCL